MTHTLLLGPGLTTLSQCPERGSSQDLSLAQCRHRRSCCAEGCAIKQVRPKKIGGSVTAANCQRAESWRCNPDGGSLQRNAAAGRATARHFN
eukprot:5283943-Pleurochrysis_carterae.AAC.1